MQGIYNIISKRENMTYLCNYPIFPYEGHYWPFEPIDLGFFLKSFSFITFATCHGSILKSAQTFVLADFLKVLTQCAYDFPKMWIIVMKK